MTPETITTIVGAWLVAATVVLGWIAKWILTNKETIIKVIQAIQEIRHRVDEHDDLSGLNPARNGYTALPAPTSTPTNPNTKP